MKRFWMRTLIGQWVALMLLALIASQLIFFFIYRAEQARTVFELRRDEFLARVASASRLLATVQQSLHPEILQTTSSAVARYWVTPGPPSKPVAWQREAAGMLLASIRPPSASDLLPEEKAGWQIITDENRFGETKIRLIELKSWNGLGVAVPLGDGTWLNAVYAKPVPWSGPPPTYYISLAITAVLLSLVSILIARRVGMPLQDLTDAAEKLGRGEEISAVPEEGPDDVRRVAAAFNRMQSRMHRFVEDRTRMIAAISHDLRTPITTLRLRAEFIEDADMRDKFISTLDEMKSMAESTLAFAREDAAGGETRAVDLNALLGSLCANLSELGLDIHFPETAESDEAGRIVLRCRPEALRRAFRNVIENAVRYGTRARVSVKATAEGVDVLVADDGPGIPLADREKVFEPFLRLENSRNRDTGGTGLGLSIARSILRAHGGDIDFQDAPTGFLVRLHLPGHQPA